MTKRFLSVLILLLSLTMLFLCACATRSGSTPESEGDDSAYRAVYTAYLTFAEEKSMDPLTYEEWLASVRGSTGEDGLTPYIGENGNWWIGTTDTGVVASGADGIGIASVDKISSEGKTDHYRITFTDGTDVAFDVTNGADGVGISDADLNDAGELVLTMTDGTENNVGKIADIQANASGESPITICLHAYGETEVLYAPTCTSIGVSVAVCESCGYEKHTYTESLGHTFGEWQGREATCTEDGLMLRACTVCAVASYEYTPAMGHRFVSGVCTVCSAAEPHVHFYENPTVIVPPTCGTDGVSSAACSCGETKVSVIPATGAHEYGGATVSVAPTCGTEGLGIADCVCGATKQIVLPATGNHSFENNVCTVCGAEDRDENENSGALPPLPGYDPEIDGDVPNPELPTVHEHAFGNSTVTTIPTCTRDGVQTTYCICGEIGRTVLPALGHTFADGVCTVCGGREDDVYTITFVTGDTQRVLTVGKDFLPSYEGEVADFNGMQFVTWYPALAPVTENATYTAIYTDVITPELFLSMLNGEYGYSQKQYTTTTNLWRDMQAMAEIYTLVLQQHEYPQPLVAEVIVHHIRGMISEKCLLPIDCSTNWNYGMTAATFAMIKDTPSIWGLLSASDIERMDTMLLAFAYIHSIGTSDYNDYRTGPGLGGNYRKTWNPNYRLGNVTGMAFIPYYFGNGDIDDGAAWLNEKIRTFDETEYERMIGKFSIYGWDEAYACWTTEGTTAGNGAVSTSTAKQMLIYGGSVTHKSIDGQTLQNSSGVGVNNGGRDYTYTGYFGTSYTLYQPEMILRDLAYYNFSGGEIKSDFYYDVGNGLEKLAGISDGTTSPYEGQTGMLLEFASGNRSSASYCNDDFIITTLMFSAASHLPRYEVNGESRTVKTVNGGQTVYLYDVTADATLWSMAQYGNEDFIYKVIHGYDNIASGSYGSNVTSSTNESNIGSGYHMMKALWRNTLLPLGTVAPVD